MLRKRYVVLFAAALLIWSGIGIGFHLAWLRDLVNSYRFVAEFWWPMEMSDAKLALRSLLDTLEIAVFSTIVAVLVAFPMSFLAARNTTPNRWVYHSCRFLLNVLRSIPEIVLALIFIPTLGLGPLPAVMALVIHNFGVFGKLFSEMIESMEQGPQEAMKALGSRQLLVSLYGIVPQMLPLAISQYFYRLEVAIRTSLVLGIVGAGGIGQLLYNDFKQFMYQKVTFELLLIMLLVTLVDYIGAYVRKRVN